MTTASPPAPAPVVALPPPPPGPGVVALRVVGSLVAVLMAAGATVGVVAGFFRQGRTEAQVYQGVTAVSVSTTTGTVSVRAGGPGDPVTLIRHLSWSFEQPRSVETVAAGRLDVRADCATEIGFGLCAVGYDLVVPPDVTLTLESHTGSLEVAGTSGELTATTSTGSVELRDLRARRVEAHTSTGSVEVTFAAAPDYVRADASTGSVEIVVPADGTRYAVTASTSTGSNDVRVPVDSSSPHRLYAHTSTGSVDVHPAP